MVSIASSTATGWYLNQVREYSKADVSVMKQPNVEAFKRQWLVPVVSALVLPILSAVDLTAGLVLTALIVPFLLMDKCDHIKNMSLSILIIVSFPLLLIANLFKANLLPHVIQRHTITDVAIAIIRFMVNQQQRSTRYITTIFTAPQSENPRQTAIEDTATHAISPKSGSPSSAVSQQPVSVAVVGSASPMDPVAEFMSLLGAYNGTCEDANAEHLLKLGQAISPEHRASLSPQQTIILDIAVLQGNAYKGVLIAAEIIQQKRRVEDALLLVVGLARTAGVSEQLSSLVKKLATSGFIKVNGVNEKGETALMLAVRSGRAEMVKALIKLSDINQESTDGRVALHYILDYNNRAHFGSRQGGIAQEAFEIIKLLVPKTDSKYISQVFQSLFLEKSNQPFLIEALLEAGVKAPESFPLTEMAEKEQMEIALNLMKDAALHHCPSTLEMLFNYGYKLIDIEYWLCTTIQTCYILDESESLTRTVEILIKMEKDRVSKNEPLVLHPTRKNFSFATPLEYALTYKCFETAKLLVKSGYPIPQADKTPLLGRQHQPKVVIYGKELEELRKYKSELRQASVAQ